MIHHWLQRHRTHNPPVIYTLVQYNMILEYHRVGELVNKVIVRRCTLSGIPVACWPAAAALLIGTYLNRVSPPGLSLTSPADLNSRASRVFF